MRKGTLATQIAAARSAGGDAFGNDTSVWDKFQRRRGPDRSRKAIETEVDAAMRGEDADARLLSGKIDAAAAALPAATDAGEDPLAVLKAKVEADRAAKQKQLAAISESAQSAKKKE